MNTIYFNDLSILLHFRERERERQLLLTVKAKHTSAPIGRAIFTRIWEDERQLQEVVNFKHACVPTGRAIFNWLCVSIRLLSYWTRHFQLNMRRRAELKMPSFLFVAPFSSDSTFITCDHHLDMRFVLILNYKHVRTAGFRVQGPVLAAPAAGYASASPPPLGRRCRRQRPGWRASAPPPCPPDRWRWLLALLPHSPDRWWWLLALLPHSPDRWWRLAPPPLRRLCRRCRSPGSSGRRCWGPCWLPLSQGDLPFDPSHLGPYCIRVGQAVQELPWVEVSFH